MTNSFNFTHVIEVFYEVGDEVIQAIKSLPHVVGVFIEKNNPNIEYDRTLVDLDLSGYSDDEVDTIYESIDRAIDELCYE